MEDGNVQDSQANVYREEMVEALIVAEIIVIHSKVILQYLHVYRIPINAVKIGYGLEISQVQMQLMEMIFVGKVLTQTPAVVLLINPDINL